MSLSDSPIFPSLIAHDQDEFAMRLMKISFAHKVHIDIMDGKFVPSISFSAGSEFSFKHLKHFDKVEVHLMVVNPIYWVEYLANVVDLFIIHAEIPDVEKVIHIIKSQGKKVGLAFNPETELSDYVKLLGMVDHVTIMTVRPGQYGSKFIPLTLLKVTQLRKAYPQLDIECDGSMNENTIVRAKKAGANLFVAGSVLQNADFPQNKFELLNELIKND